MSKGTCCQLSNNRRRVVHISLVLHWRTLTNKTSSSLNKTLPKHNGTVPDGKHGTTDQLQHNDWGHKDADKLADRIILVRIRRLEDDLLQLRTEKETRHRQTEPQQTVLVKSLEPPSARTHDNQDYDACY